MRDYLSIPNLLKAMTMALFVTILSTPHIVRGMNHIPGTGNNLPALITLAFLAMTLTCGAVTAWGARGGMRGPFPGKKELRTGLIAAGILVVIAIPVHYFRLGPDRQLLIAHSKNRALADLQFPSTLEGCVSLMLWSASFEMIFLTASSMSFFSRLTGNWMVALMLTVTFDAGVELLQIHRASMVTPAWNLLLPSVVINGLSCLFFARSGLIPAALFSGGMNLYMFLHL